MLMILIALIALTVLSAVVFMAADNFDSILCLMLGSLAATGAAIGLLSYAFTGWSYLAAEYKADIINREYGTNYTQEEVFWASGVIETIRELDRKRVELNGDLIREVSSD